MLVATVVILTLVFILWRLWILTGLIKQAKEDSAIAFKLLGWLDEEGGEQAFKECLGLCDFGLHMFMLNFKVVGYPKFSKTYAATFVSSFIHRHQSEVELSGGDMSQSFKWQISEVQPRRHFLKLVIDTEERKLQKYYKYLLQSYKSRKYVK